MTGAILTAGLVDGGQHLVLPLVVGASMVVIAVRGGGAWQFPRRR